MTFETLKLIGPLDAFVLLFSIVATVLLFAGRLRRCRRGSSAYDLRDFALLLIGPIVSVLLLLIYASLAAAYYGTSDLDSDHPLRLGMRAAAGCVSVGLSCFVLGVIGILWPVSHVRPE